MKVIDRPISLFNVDAKILRATLARRLQKVIPSIIHLSQAGLIKNTQASDSVRLVIYSMTITANKLESAILIFLEPEKAFMIQTELVEKIRVSTNFCSLFPTTKVCY